MVYLDRGAGGVGGGGGEGHNYLHNHLTSASSGVKENRICTLVQYGIGLESATSPSLATKTGAQCSVVK